MLSHVEVWISSSVRLYGHLNRCAELLLILPTENLNRVELNYSLVRVLRSVDHPDDFIHQCSRANTGAPVPILIFEDAGEFGDIEQRFRGQKSEEEMLLQSPLIEPDVLDLLSGPLKTFPQLN